MNKYIHSYTIRDNFVVFEVKIPKDGDLTKETILINKDVLKDLIKELAE